MRLRLRASAAERPSRRAAPGRSLPAGAGPARIQTRPHPHLNRVFKLCVRIQMRPQILDTGGTVLADLNTQPGTSFAGGSRNSDWSDHDKHGTHVSVFEGVGVEGPLRHTILRPIWAGREGEGHRRQPRRRLA